ncbi:energy transducer TonB [Pseudoalteromonas phenolica]|uniref:Energy transducer TonB n=1 Tax=Pseudoalteromonas phenolica TaxID=161398 RepID=A0A4Q7IQ27_9GAMM|nr:energy transducer TonB [Pseudoalteromonas phenolica]RZQ54513.1 energy transducer TonB [Pseudoalteromonas phenolica]
MNRALIAFSFLSLLSTTGSFASNTDLNASFNNHYKAYQAAVKSGDKESIIKSARQAYEIGQQFYGEHDVNTVNLAINYANALDNKNPDKLALLESNLRIVETHHKENLYTIFDITLPIAQITFDKKSRAALNSLKEIGQKAEERKDYEFAAIAYHEAIKLAVQKSKTLPVARKLIRRNDDINKAHLPEVSVQRLTSDMWVASLDEARNRKKAAINRLEHVVKVFDQNLDFDHPFELTAHSKLVNLYEKSGQSDKATKHCLAIAKMVPWKDTQEQEPLYRAHPKYPSNMARRMKSGWVKLQFTISKSGFVKNIEVMDSSEKGFEKASVKALEQWRYAPKFEDGKPVEAVSTVQLDYIIPKS